MSDRLSDEDLRALTSHGATGVVLQPRQGLELLRELLDLRAENARIRESVDDEVEARYGYAIQKAEAERDKARGALRALEDRVLLAGTMPIPCIICGANGPRFYQPAQHHCIERRQELERAALGEQP